VGGEKVFPAEVESVLLEMPDVADATVHGEKHPITGQIVCARVTLTSDQPAGEFTAELKHFCRQRLERFKVPVKVALSRDPQYGSRFKRMRRREP
jgi:acyl-coenzyme A synthetase/AMP-(fatty) acid ligase